MKAQPQRQKLTVKRIDSLRYAGSRAANGKWTRHVCWDTEVRGLGVRVLPTVGSGGRNEKRFVLFYRHQGRQRLMNLGRYGTMTLEQARKAARKFLTDVADGNDPLGNRHRDREAETVRQLCADYLERHAKRRKRSWKKDQRYIERFVIPRWGTAKAKAVSRRDVEALHQKLGRETPYQANRVLELVRSIFNFALLYGYVDPAQQNPADGVAPFREISRKRRLDFDAELPNVLAAIDQEKDVFVRAYFWLLILTGCRKTELLGAKWDQIKWEVGLLDLPETKSGEPQVKPLSPEAIQLLRNLQEHGDPRSLGSPYIFPGRVSEQPLVNVDKAWARVRKRAGVTDVRLHDLRRSVGSWLADQGHSLGLIARVLHHSSTKTTETYARLSEDVARRALDEQNKRIVRAVEKDDLAPEANEARAAS